MEAGAHPKVEVDRIPDLVGEIEWLPGGAVGASDETRHAGQMLLLDCLVG